MEENQIRLLIVDDSKGTCDILKNYFALIPNIEVCGVVHDGEEALFTIGQQKPDVVLLDLVMPKYDGISVLERLRRVEISYKPQVIVTSAVGQQTFTGTALSLGAVYYMIKPYDLDDLRARICTAASKTERQIAKPSREQWQLIISRALLELNVPVHMLGYRYCCAGVGQLLQENRPQSIVKGIYADIARDYDTTPECVEGAIRKAIRRAWEEDPAGILALTGGSGQTPPSNGRFLITLSQKLKLLSEQAQKGESGNGVQGKTN